MKVSVVICTYSDELYWDFCEAVDSVLDQTYKDRDVVVVVDGNQELYERALGSYEANDEVQIYCNDRNRGLLESRNRGAEYADGDVVAFLDDDAVADPEWLERLVEAYESHDVIAAGGRMTGIWVAGRPGYLPEEFNFLVGVTHRGFADEPGEVRNTFGSNISFERDVFLELGGFDTDIGGRKGDKNLQGGETELCARMREEYRQGVWYVPEATVGHKVFNYRTNLHWLLNRAFWQGYSKRAMSVLVPESGDEETSFLQSLLTESVPQKFSACITERSVVAVLQLVMLFVFTGFVGLGYLYGMVKYR